MITKRYIVRHKDTHMYPFIRANKDGSYDFMWGQQAIGWMDALEKAKNKIHLLESVINQEDLRYKLEIVEQEITG